MRGAPRSPLLRWVRPGEDSNDWPFHGRGHVSRPRVVRHDDRRPSDERRELSETRLASQGYPGVTGDPVCQVLFTRSSGNEHRQLTLRVKLLNDRCVAFRRIGPGRGARPRMHEDEALDTASLQKTCRSFLILLARDEHHLRLYRREAQEPCQLQAAYSFVLGRHGLFIAVAVSE